MRSNHPDTLDRSEQLLIASVAECDLPDHQCAVQSNEEGMAWAVLKPKSPFGGLCFTICRISPCIVVLIEDDHARRQIRSLASLEEALAFVRSVCQEAEGAGSDRTYH